MGERTQALLGTDSGDRIVSVFSGNPKTSDGYNTFIFRRRLQRSLDKLRWAKVIDGRTNPVPSGVSLGDKGVRYSEDEKKLLLRFVKAAASTQRARIENDDFGTFDIGRTFVDEVQCHAISTRREVEAVSSAREIAATMVHVCGSPNEEVVKKKGIKYFEYGFAKILLSDGLYLAMGEVGIRVDKRAYYDQRIVAKFKADSEVTSLHGQSRIGESASDEIYDIRFRLILQGGELYFLQQRGVAYNHKNASRRLANWIADKRNLVLITGKSSYFKCGAGAFLSPYLEGKQVLHLTTVGENARKEDVDVKVSEIISEMPVEDRNLLAFIAVGGGTVIDTTKLVRDAVNSAAPFLAIPTTAGTGAETTRFAVYYDHGKKMSADDVRYLPTDIILIPEFAESQSDYQKASTEFDAYAQTVESLWAKGATEESKRYARKALDLMASGWQTLGSYWAGKAIDLSRTTAAHAFSYYLTAHYGVPHGAAVYMMFPYICRANGHPEYIRQSARLKTLREFAAEKQLEWSELVDDLFAHVNPDRLSNNPCKVKKEVFFK